MSGKDFHHESDEPTSASQDFDRDGASDVLSEEQLAALRAERDELKDKLLRAQAEGVNISRRGQQQYTEAVKYGGMNLARGLLPVYDNLEKTLSLLDKSRKDDPLVQGAHLIMDELTKVFQQNGIVPIESVGKHFDPNLHEALMQDYDSDLEPGMVASEFQRGYRMHDRVLRHAKVTVAAEKPGNDE